MSLLDLLRLLQAQFIWIHISQPALPHQFLRSDKILPRQAEPAFQSILEHLHYICPTLYVSQFFYSQRFSSGYLPTVPPHYFKLSFFSQKTALNVSHMEGSAISLQCHFRTTVLAISVCGLSWFRYATLLVLLRLKNQYYLSCSKQPSNVIYLYILHTSNRDFPKWLSSKRILHMGVNASVIDFVLRFSFKCCFCNVYLLIYLHWIGFLRKPIILILPFHWQCQRRCGNHFNSTSVQLLKLLTIIEKKHASSNCLAKEYSGPETTLLHHN